MVDGYGGSEKDRGDSDGGSKKERSGFGVGGRTQVGKCRRIQARPLMTWLRNRIVIPYHINPRTQVLNDRSNPSPILYLPCFPLCFFP